MMNCYYQNYGSVNILGGLPATSTEPAQYRLIEQHYFNFKEYDYDDIITEGLEVPFGWVPTLGVDPLNSNAAAAFWLAGPRDLETNPSNDLSIYNNLYRSHIRPVTYWEELPAGSTFHTSYINYGQINILTGPTSFALGPGNWVLTGLGVVFGSRRA